MVNYNFGLSAEGWSGMTWEVSVGSPLGGALVAGFGTPTNDFGVNSGGASIGSLSIPVALDDPFSFRVRVINDDGSGDSGDVTVSLTANGTYQVSDQFSIVSGVPFDSGWVYLSDVFPGSDTITDLAFAATASEPGVLFAVYFDSVYVAESPPTSQLRHLGLSADSTYLYRTSIEDGTLRLRFYDLATLAAQGSSDFGAAAYDDPDNLISGLYPVVKPGADGVVFVFGEDGADAQLLVSPDNGQNFSDLSDAGWSGKFVVALLIDPLNPADMVAVFADDDIYRSEDGGQTWSKTGDASDTLRKAERHLTEPEELLLAAQAADTLEFTNNYGGTFEDVSETVGTVNVIRGSR
jgi:hypothetical protein